MAHIKFPVCLIDKGNDSEDRVIFYDFAQMRRYFNNFFAAANDGKDFDSEIDILNWVDNLSYLNFTHKFERVYIVETSRGVVSRTYARGVIGKKDNALEFSSWSGLGLKYLHYKDAYSVVRRAKRQGISAWVTPLKEEDFHAWYWDSMRKNAEK